MQGFSNNDHKPFPTHDKILELLTDQQIFQSYIPNITFNRAMNSPLGDKDDTPSFSVFWSFRYSKYLFKEHRYGWFGDCFDFVQRLYGYSSLKEALMQICIDFGFDQFYINKNIKRGVINIPKKFKKVRKAGQVNLGVTLRDWKEYDLEYWEQYGITKEWLDISGIYPIKYYFINNTTCIADKYAYVYIENKDGKKTYKIYQPYSKEKKWVSNNDRSVWELWSVIPDTFNILVITKSRKDALSIMNTCKIPAISLQAEGTIPKEQVVGELKERFKNIYLLYDNDFDKSTNYGRNYGRRLSDLFDIPQIELPEGYGMKDYSDLVQAYGNETAKAILIDVIKKG